MDINITPNNIHITDSYQVKKKDILPYCVTLQRYAEDMGYPVGNRTPEDMADEWYVHNLLYKLNIQRERTKDVDLDYPQSRSLSIGYSIFGWVSSAFLK